MKREEIVKRLLDQGHIVIKCANRILNKKGEYLVDIEDLWRDGNISTEESIVLMNENPTPDNPTSIQYTPNHDWTWDPNRTGSPYWQVTCSSPLGYPDTKWPGEEEN